MPTRISAGVRIGDHPCSLLMISIDYKFHVLIDLHVYLTAEN